MVNVCGTQDPIAKATVWNNLITFIQQHQGRYVVFGDLNEVRDESKRVGTNFSRSEAHLFNSFVDDSGLKEMAMGGKLFTWMNKSGTKMSKLDWFLLSEEVLDENIDLKCNTPKPVYKKALDDDDGDMLMFISSLDSRVNLTKYALSHASRRATLDTPDIHAGDPKIYLNCTYGDGKPITCCGCEGPLNGGFCLFCTSRAGNSFDFDPNPNSFDDSKNLSDYPPQPQYQAYSCELCGNDAYYGYDCPPQVPFDIDYVEASPLDSELVSLEEVKDDILREKLLNINLLIAKIESLNDNPTSDCVLKSPSLFPILVEDSDSFFEKSDTSLSYSDNSLPEFETFSDHTEETSSGSTTTHADNSLPEYDSFLFEIEPDHDELTSVFIEDILR
nr:RNA-directed DNA polymerase, eukaryota, reverse transcriptase zinc-binding domain protein [Tanacetum cinerariifolium]